MTGTHTVTGRPARPRRRPAMVAGGVVALLVALVVALVGVRTIVRSMGHGDPDPGGRVLGALKSIESAVPEGSTETTTQYAEPHWDSCDGRAGTFGWSPIAVIITFRTTMLAEALLRSADGPMAAAGWSTGRTLPSPLGPGQTWTRTLADGTAALASLTPGTTDNGASVSWSFTAYAPPHGPQANGC